MKKEDMVHVRVRVLRVRVYAYTRTHIYNGILLSHKNEQNNAICSNMEGPRDYHTKSDRERKILYNHSYVKFIFKKGINEIHLQNRNRLTDIKKKFLVTKGDRWGGGINQELGMDTPILLYIR